MKKIVMTGGGTAGHVTPNIALFPSLKKAGYDITYIGSHEGIEKRLIEEQEIKYFSISTGKLRRYFDFKNFSDFFRVMRGYIEAKALLKEIKPDVVFSKGGFVAVPVVRAAASLKIPCIIHESDMTPGLANKLCIPVATKICCNFPETLKNMPAQKSIHTGSPIRQELTLGNRKVGLSLCGFNENKPVLMIMGGSQGAQSVNETVREALPKLLLKYQIVHLCGKDKVDNMKLGIEGYKQFDYVGDELKDIYAATDIIVSRAGANAICELLELSIPNVLIPLSGGSRGDQILNATSFAEKGFSEVIREEALDPSILVETVDKVYENRDRYIAAMKKNNELNPIEKIMGIIEGVCE